MLPKSFDIVDKILQYTVVAANALQDVAAATQIPFLNSVCTLSLTIIPIVQTTRFQRNRCLRLVEEIHKLLYALMSLCGHSDDIRPPKMLDQIAQCALTLQKFHTCLRAQRELGTIKRLFKQNEIMAQLDSCEAELKATLEIFTMESGVGMASALVEFSIDTERRHQELLELISSQNGSIDNASSIGRSSINTSSGSLSVLPAYPKIFHGRESELNDLINSLLCDPARAAILGPGGMGKTSLAMAALHHPAIMEKYNLRHFISCESANTCAGLVRIIGLQLGVEPSTSAIVRHFGQCGPCLVVLDNFETPWETIESRAQVEEFLSLLADIPSLALLLTMRGAERPGKVKWNRPFLSPLEPLSPSASRQIFVEVADEPDSGEESALDDLLDLSGSLPLAVSLMANIVSFEGYFCALARWQKENTALLSEGHDKRSNLEKSITLSLSSPRISTSPHAKYAIYLISLLSLLPDGIRPQDLLAAKVPIPNVHQCQSVLVGTSLAYIDVKGRLKTLSPVREYIRRVHPPTQSLSRPLRIYFQDLLELWRSKRQLPSGNLAPELFSNLGNIDQLILEGLRTGEKSVWIAIANSIITLDHFSVTMLKGHSPLFQRLPHLIEATGDAALRWSYACRILRNAYNDLVQDPDSLIREGVQYFNAGTHPVRQAISFYNAVACHHSYAEYRNISKATEFNKRAFALAQRADDTELQLVSLETEHAIAWACRDAYWILKVVFKAQDIAGLVSMGPREHSWIAREAWAHLWAGNLSRALDLCTQGEGLLTSLGMEGSEADLEILDLRADVLWLKSEYSEAHRVFAQMVKKTSPTCSPRYHAHALCGIAEMDILMEGKVTDIVSNLSAAETVYMALGSPRVLFSSWVGAQLKLLCGDIDNGRAALLECLSKSRDIYPDITQFCLAALADPAHRMHRLMDTFHWAVVHLAFVQKSKDPAGMLQALRRLADLHMTMDDDETALHLFHVVLEKGTKMDMHRLRAECMVGIGDIMLRRGDPRHAKEIWGAAHPLFVRSLRMKDAAAVEKRLEQLSHTRLEVSRAKGSQ